MGVKEGENEEVLGRKENKNNHDGIISSFTDVILIMFINVT